MWEAALLCRAPREVECRETGAAKLARMTVCSAAIKWVLGGPTARTGAE
jgi:hypothetical protein